MELIRKTFNAVTKTIDVEAGIFEAMITTENLDRVGDVVRAAGADITAFMSNAVVLWGHEYSEPAIAKAISLEIIPGVGIKSAFQFPERGVYPKADLIRSLWGAGFLNAVSIGFIPIEFNPLNGGIEYTKWEMLEYSVVNVPAQQGALRLSIDDLYAVQKRGRVLSSANEGKLRRAAEIINEVLAQVGDEPQQDALNDSTAEPSTNPTSNNVSEAEQTQIAERLSHIFGAWIKD
jgi:phage head maturation protease